MSQNLNLAQQFAWSLASSLMACITLFRADGGYAVIPSDEFDGDPDTIVREYDPWAG
jgi:hypothetical protein